MGHRLKTRIKQTKRRNRNRNKSRNRPGGKKKTTRGGSGKGSRSKKGQRATEHADNSIMSINRLPNGGTTELRREKSDNRGQIGNKGGQEFSKNIVQQGRQKSRRRTNHAEPTSPPYLHAQKAFGAAAPNSFAQSSPRYSPHAEEAFGALAAPNSFAQSSPQYSHAEEAFGEAAAPSIFAQSSLQYSPGAEEAFGAVAPHGLAQSAGSPEITGTRGVSGHYTSPANGIYKPSRKKKNFVANSSQTLNSVQRGVAEQGSTYPLPAGISPAKVPIYTIRRANAKFSRRGKSGAPPTPVDTALASGGGAGYALQQPMAVNRQLDAVADALAAPLGAGGGGNNMAVNRQHEAVAAASGGGNNMALNRRLEAEPAAAGGGDSVVQNEATRLRNEAAGGRVRAASVGPVHYLTDDVLPRGEPIDVDKLIEQESAPGGILSGSLSNLMDAEYVRVLIEHIANVQRLHPRQRAYYNRQVREHMLSIDYMNHLSSRRPLTAEVVQGLLPQFQDILTVSHPSEDKLLEDLLREIRLVQPRGGSKELRVIVSPTHILTTIRQKIIFWGDMFFFENQHARMKYNMDLKERAVKIAILCKNAGTMAEGMLGVFGPARTGNHSVYARELMLYEDFVRGQGNIAEAQIAAMSEPEAINSNLDTIDRELHIFAKKFYEIYIELNSEELSAEKLDIALAKMDTLMDIDIPNLASLVRMSSNLYYTEEGTREMQNQFNDILSKLYLLGLVVKGKRKGMEDLRLLDIRTLLDALHRTRSLTMVRRIAYYKTGVTGIRESLISSARKLKEALYNSGDILVSIMRRLEDGISILDIFTGMKQITIVALQPFFSIFKSVFGREVDVFTEDGELDQRKVETAVEQLLAQDTSKDTREQADIMLRETQRTIEAYKDATTASERSSQNSSNENRVTQQTQQTIAARFEAALLREPQPSPLQVSAIEQEIKEKVRAQRDAGGAAEGGRSLQQSDFEYANNAENSRNRGRSLGTAGGAAEQYAVSPPSSQGSGDYPTSPSSGTEIERSENEM
jgi:hypothetical protein